jgi:Domain of unknown function (DUF222)/HNH endonuclease
VGVVLLVPSSAFVILSNMCSLTIDETTTETPADASELGTLPVERLEREITRLAAHVNAATCRWLLLVAEFDRREGWAGWGCRSCAQWLSYRCGLSPAAAREQLRVARSLGGLPEIAAAFGRGELCYSQVRALTRVATAETEGQLVMIARHASAAQLERIVRGFRWVVGYELGRPGHESRYVRCDRDDDGSLLLRARLPAEEGALVLAALEAGRDALRDSRAGSASDEATHSGDRHGPDGGDEPRAPGHWEARERGADAGAGSASDETTHIGDRHGPDGDDEPRAPGERASVSNADALVLMAQTLLSSGPADRAPADGYQVVVHVDAAALAGDEDGDGDGGCRLEDGGALHPETARRLGCDAALVRILERDGRPLSIGRKTRSVPPALRRALQSRDPLCRFPGCDRRRFLHAHHLDHWARGGRTELTNLVRLCSHHHRLVHEGGYRVERSSRGGLRFRRPDGQPVPAAPPRPAGDPAELQRGNRDRGLELTDQTCVPSVYPDKLDLHWVVAGLADADGRLIGTPPTSPKR